MKFLPTLLHVLNSENSQMWWTAAGFCFNIHLGLIHLMKKRGLQLNNFTSFMRQLSLYGFKVTQQQQNGKKIKFASHPMFFKGIKSSDLKLIKRKQPGITNPVFSKPVSFQFSPAPLSQPQSFEDSLFSNEILCEPECEQLREPECGQLREPECGQLREPECGQLREPVPFEDSLCTDEIFCDPEPKPELCEKHVDHLNNPLESQQKSVFYLNYDGSVSFWFPHKSFWVDTPLYQEQDDFTQLLKTNETLDANDDECDFYLFNDVDMVIPFSP
jgi:hypothetical protein